MGRFTPFLEEPVQSRPNPAAVAQTSQYDPDTAAQAQEMSTATGLPVDVVATQLPALQTQRDVGRFTQFVFQNPEVDALGGDFAAVARDDVDTLDRIRITGNNLRAGIISIVGGGAGIMRSVEEAFDVGENVLRGTSDALLGTEFGANENSRFKETAEFFAEMQKAGTILSEALTLENEKLSPFEQGVFGGVQSLATNLPILAGSVIAKNPQMALTGMTGIVYGNEYGRARDEGLGIAQSILFGGTQAAIENVTERIPIGALFGDIATKTDLLRTLATQLATEIPGEQVATVLQDFTDFVALRPEATLQDYIDERPEAAYQTFVATVVAAGTQTALVHQLGTRLGGDAARAEANADVLKELAQLSEASKLRERSPEQFKRYVETIAPGAELFIDPEDLQEALDQSDSELLPDDLDARIAEAAETDSPVRITAAEYATYFAESHTAKFISERIRVGAPNAMNVEEAQKVESEFAARAEQVLAESQDGEVLRAEGRRINEQVRAQITSTGRFRTDVASAYASLVENFFVTMSSRAGLTPGQLFEQFPLRVQANIDQDANNADVSLEQLPPEAFEVDRSSDGRDFVIRATDAGNEAGRMELESTGTNWESGRQTKLAIRLSEVPVSRRGEGIGQQLIERAYQEAQSRGLQLVSDHAVSALQLRAYEGLRRKGWIIRYTDPEKVRAILELADQTESRGGKGLSVLGVSVGIGESVVREIRPPPEAAQLDPNNLRPAAALAAEAGELPQGFTRFRHFGNFIVPQLDPEFMGTGMPGQERERAGPNVVSLYPDTGFERESGVGPVEYAVDIPTEQLYNANEDPLDLVEKSQQAVSFNIDDDGNMVPTETRFDMDAFENAVRDAGYLGYVTPGAPGNLRGQARVFEPISVVGARTSVVEETAALFQLHPENEPQGFDLVAPYLTDDERSRLMKTSAATLVRVFKSLPKDADFSAAALAGAAKRGWYASATQALRQVFGDTDAPRFAALLAATSPQIGLQMNLQNASAIWAKWDAAGRPTSKQQINKVMDDALGGAQSVLNAWRNNAVRALSAEDPYTVTLSGPKVNSFMRNLMGDVQEVTNDTWMANFAAVDQILLKGGGTKTGPGKRPGYLAFVAKIRRVAAKLSKDTGETWTPAEVQETVWSWAKTAYELADIAGETRSVEELVRAGEITDARVAGASDFATMLKTNAPIRSILEAAGYGDAINAVEAEFGSKSDRDTDHALVTPALLRSARRLDEVRRVRAEGASQQEATNPLAGTLLNIGMAVSDGSKLTQADILAKLDELEAKIERTVVYESNTEPTLVVKLTSPLKKAELDALSEDLRQEAIVQTVDGKGALYGPQAEKWGPYNPEFFLTLDGSRASEVQSEALEQTKLPTERAEQLLAELRKLAPESAVLRRILDENIPVEKLLKPAGPLAQTARGEIRLGRDVGVPSVVTLFEDADLSTFLHESGHFFFEIMADLAARPNAPAAIRADMQTLLTWVKFSGTIEEWRALPVQERRAAHEQFARGFEAWLLEGNAPSQELRPLFHRFRSWLINLYKSITKLNVSLTDEVRTVLAGMVASEDQIKVAEAARSYAPLFTEQTASGMTPEEWQAYQDTTRAATEQAQDALQARSMRNLRWLDNARSKELKKLQAENAAKRAAVQAEVEAEIGRQPARVAETLILEGTAWVENLVDGQLEEIKLEGPHKLSRAALEDAYGTRQEHRELAEAAGLDPTTMRAPWQTLPRSYIAEQGLSADEMAELVGMSSGDQLISELLALEPRALVVENATNQLMMERYGDLSNAQTLARAVDLAVHNQHRSRVVTTELAALDQALKTQPGGIATVRRAARDYASRVVQRKKIRDIRPAQFTAAETKAARDSKTALAAGDLKLAATRKRDQLFNGYAARDASRALDTVDKELRYLRSFNNESTRKSLESSYRDQIDKLLERFDLRKRSLREVDKRTALGAWIKEQESQGNDPLIPDELQDEARRTNYQNLTVEEFAGLVDSIKNIEHLARLKKKLLAAAEQRDFDQAVTELVTSIDDNATRTVKAGLEKDLSLWGKFAETLSEWLTHLRKMSSVTRQIDGGQDGGKFWEYMMRPLNTAADKEVAMRADATKRLNALLDSLPALRQTFLQRTGQKIKGPAKLYIPEISASLSLEARIAVALNWGNEGNRQRIMEGNRWTEGQVQAIINTLTKEEMDFVQATFDFIGSYWPEIAAKEERVTGVAPKRVESMSIQSPHGQYAGGYYPIVADPARSDKAAQQNDAELIAQSLRGAVSRATTRRGHTKARVGGTDPVRLDLGVITQHVAQVTHDLSWHEALIDAGRLLRDSRVSGSLREHYGAEVTRLMRKTLDDVARGEVFAQDAGERLVNHFRVGATIAGLGFSVTTMLLQPTGVTQSFIRVGYSHVAKGLIEFIASPAASIKKVREASTFMRDRGLVLNRELSEITNRLGAKQGLSRFYFFPIQAFQTAVDVPTWLGAYNKAFGAGESPKRAVALADQAVRDSQSSGQLQDLSEVQRGGAYKKLLTNFYSYFSATYQLSAESIQQFKRKPSLGSSIKLASDFLMLYTVPAVLGLIIREGLRGDLDDDDELADALIKAQLSAMLGVFPFFRELGAAFQGFEYRGPAGLSFLAHMTSLIKQLEQGEIDEPLLRAANRAAGTALHYPANQVDRTVRGIIAVAEGEAGPQAILLGPPAKDK